MATAENRLVTGVVPHLYAGESNTIKVALMGCGGRGAGAASDALSVKNGPIQLVAMADVIGSRVAYPRHDKPADSWHG